MKPNRVIHFEIHASDTEKVAQWYRDMFGWEIKKWDNPAIDYWMVMTAPQGSKDIGIDGGIVKRKGPAPQPGAPVTSFVCTIGVPNLDEHVKKITDAGGKLALPKMAIPGMAWLAYCLDIDGNIFGLFQEDKNAK